MSIRCRTIRVNLVAWWPFLRLASFRSLINPDDRRIYGTRPQPGWFGPALLGPTTSTARPVRVRDLFWGRRATTSNVYKQRTATVDLSRRIDPRQYKLSTVPQAAGKQGRCFRALHPHPASSCRVAAMLSISGAASGRTGKNATNYADM